MGIEYTLVNKKNKTLFELGKGPWYDIFPPNENDSPKFLYRDTFTIYCKQILTDHWLCNNDYSYAERLNMTSYIDKLSEMIFDFIDGCDPEKDLALTNDSDDSNCENRERGYLYIGSRYTGSETYQSDIVYLNRHIASDIISKLDFTVSIARLKNVLAFL